jgi:uncharacterized protein
MSGMARWLAAMMIALSSLPVTAQTLEPRPDLVLPILAGERFVLNSAAVPGRAFHIHVRLPENYAQHPDASYPVVYLLDGDSTLAMLAPLHLFMTYEDRVPEAIMVGIGYGTFGEGNQRGLDYRAPVEGVAPPAGGGAPAFARMLREELIPEIEARYRTNPHQRILIGQSMGGQFVLWSAWNEPEAYWARIISNASLRESAPQFLQQPRMAAGSGRHLIVASGTRDRPNLRAEFLAFRQHWSDRQNLPWRLTTVDIPEGTHAADLGRVYRYAMRLLFPAPVTQAVTP